MLTWFQTSLKSDCPPPALVLFSSLLGLSYFSTSKTLPRRGGFIPPAFIEAQSSCGGCRPRGMLWLLRGHWSLDSYGRDKPAPTLRTCEFWHRKKSQHFILASTYSCVIYLSINMLESKFVNHRKRRKGYAKQLLIKLTDWFYGFSELQQHCCRGCLWRNFPTGKRGWN